MQRVRLTRRQRRRIKRTLKEAAAGAIAGLALGGLLIAGFVFDDYEPPSAPEHFGQIEYGGTWWDVDDYEEMMAEREEYLASERAEEQAFMEQVEQAQERAAEPTTQPIIGSMDWDAEESEMLARIAMAEAESEDTEGKALVILVVLNRVWNDGFPNTIEGVITEKGQFTAYENGRYDSTDPSEDCFDALDLVMSGWDESEGALYFESPSDSTWHSTHLEKLFTHGKHTFYTEK